jgi:hypothetical protein
MLVAGPANASQANPAITEIIIMTGQMKYLRQYESKLPPGFIIKIGPIYSANPIDLRNNMKARVNNPEHVNDLPCKIWTHGCSVFCATDCDETIDKVIDLLCDMDSITKLNPYPSTKPAVAE